MSKASTSVHDTRLSRRTVFAGAGVAGALATAAVVLPAAEKAAPQSSAAEPAVPSGGYQLTEHVKRYYETARV